MSSLQKFHRRTNGGVVAAIGSEAPVAGSGYWLGTAGDGSSKLIVAPKSTEVSKAFGSQGTVRGTTSTLNGLTNTDTLAGFGQTAHPAAHYCKNLTTGGYNTWYLPAKVELTTMYLNMGATPFATANGFVGSIYISSSEYDGNYSWTSNLGNGSWWNSNAMFSKNKGSYWVRAVRRSII
jgi:hypothetical protein